MLWWMSACCTSATYLSFSLSHKERLSFNLVCETQALEKCFVSRIDDVTTVSFPFYPYSYLPAFCKCVYVWEGCLLHEYRFNCQITLLSHLNKLRINLEGRSFVLLVYVGVIVILILGIGVLRI